MNDFWVACALVLVLEGVLPFLSPSSWKEGVRTLTALSDRQLRIAGLISMVIGLLLLGLLRGQGGASS